MLDTLAYKLCKTWPSELRGDKLVDLEISRVISCFMVMAVGEDRTIEGILQGNVNTAFVSQDVVIVLPI